jgi:hypothetical protein
MLERERRTHASPLSKLSLTLFNAIASSLTSLDKENPHVADWKKEDLQFEILQVDWSFYVNHKFFLYLFCGID